MDAISTVSTLAVYNKQAVTLKSMVSNSEWFNGNQMKFED